MEIEVTTSTVRVAGISGTNQTSAETDPSKNRDFSGLLTEAVDRTLTELLGAKVSEALWSRMSRDMFVGKGDVLQHVEELATFLEGIMGTASKTVERRIIKSLYAALNEEFTEPVDFGFPREVEKARIRWNEHQKLR